MWETLLCQRPVRQEGQQPNNHLKDHTPNFPDSPVFCLLGKREIERERKRERKRLYASVRLYSAIHKYSLLQSTRYWSSFSSFFCSEIQLLLLLLLQLLLLLLDDLPCNFQAGNIVVISIIMITMPYNYHLISSHLISSHFIFLLLISTMAKAASQFLIMVTNSSASLV